MTEEKELMINFGCCKIYFYMHHFMMLEPRQRHVLELRFGLNGNEKHTLKKTGELIENKTTKCKSVSPARVREIQESARRRLFHPSRHIRSIWNDEKEIITDQYKAK